MTTEERIAALLQDLVPEPPRELRLAEIAARVAKPTPAVRVVRLRRWLTPMAAAAAVVAVVETVLVVNGSSRSQPPATSTQSPTPTSTTTHSPARSTAPTSTPSPGPALTGTIHVGGATLVVPAGWVARSMPAQAMPTWCLAPKTATPAALPDCPIWFRRVVAPGPQFDPYADTAVDAFTTRCTTHEAPGHFTFATRSLGDRRADFAQGFLKCADGTRYPTTEYFVATTPGYILYSGRDDSATRAVTAALAHDATLPAQTAPLRYTILGNIASRSHQRDGYHVVLTPWTRNFGDVRGQFVPIPGGAAQTYVIPNSLVPDGGITLTGLIRLTTNGYHVTSLSIVGG